MTEENNITAKQKDSNAFIIILIILSLLGIFFGSIPFLQVYLVVALILAFVGSTLGKDRMIGSVNAFYLGYFLGVLGIIIIALSKRKDDLQPTVTNMSGTADELLKFHELKEKGIITEEEFQKQKDRLL